jgi:hypothetical protein
MVAWWSGEEAQGGQDGRARGGQVRAQPAPPWSLMDLLHPGSPITARMEWDGSGWLPRGSSSE